MYFQFKHNAIGWIYWNYTGITLKSHWMGYTETTLELHWNASRWIHWKYTETPLHLQRTPTAPPAHPNCTSSAPQLHLQRTSTAPPTHPNCTSSAPQTVHLQRTSNSAPPSTPTSFTYLHPHLQCTSTAPPSTSTAPPSTTTFTNPCLAIKSEVHLSAPQKRTPPRVRCAPPSTSAHRGYARLYDFSPSSSHFLNTSDYHPDPLFHHTGHSFASFHFMSTPMPFFVPHRFFILVTYGLSFDYPDS